MLRKVRIKQVPKARTGYQVQGSLVNDVPAMGGADYNAYIGTPRTEVSRTLKAVPREVANLEAEGGETVVGDLDGSTMPSFKTIVGPRHSEGGVPLALPDDSFIFSDTKSMKISDPKLLKMFNKPAKKGGYTPAELSKQYDINKYRKILQDPNSDKISRNTAEIMIKNYVMKLGALALAQESKKGFPQGIPLIAKPYMEANKIAEEDLIPELAQEQPEQQMMPQEGMQPQMEAPQTTPDGQPVAMPQGTPDQMMQAPEEMSPEMMGQAPMAAYGMEMGGFYPEYAFGGYYYDDGGKTTSKTKSKEQLEKELREGKAKVQKTKTLPDGTVEITRADGTKVYAKGTSGETINVEDPQRQKVTKQTANPAQYKKDICARIKSGGYTAEQAANAGWISKDQIANFKGCENLKKSETESSEFYELEEQPSTIPGKKKCKCTDPNTGEERIFEIEKDEECICESEEEVTTKGAIPPVPRRDAEFWQQDIINAAGAFGDRASLRKQMPWEARVDLEEPRPTFLDPTRQLAQQSEQANIASQATAQFASPQAMGARLAAIQGQGAAQAANTLSQINNQNVGIANQFEANQVGVRNQEQMMNQQMANRLFDKNVIAQQQFDNAKRQSAANMRQAYNTALTNKWKTDALNQMYPNYQVDPLSGGRVQYTPTPKTPNPTKPGEDDIEYIRSLEKAGLSKEAISAAVKARFTGKKFGGATMFEDGGYIYTVFPSVTL